MIRDREGYWNGETITIEELPIGCVIHDKVRDTSVVVRTIYDAKELIESLNFMLDCWSEK